MHRCCTLGVLQNLSHPGDGSLDGRDALLHFHGRSDPVSVHVGTLPFVFMPL